MAVIGEIIKGAIGVGNALFSDSDPVKSQHKVLKELIEAARLTAFGRRYHFDKMLQDPDSVVQAFQSGVPIHDYDKIYEDWWHFLLEGHQNVTWPGGQRYFAISSGTTSTSKSIPVTNDMLESIRKAGIEQILATRNFDLPGNFFEKQVVMLGSSISLIQKLDHEEGEISGISASQLPGWFRGFYKPGNEIASIRDWDERVRRIAEEAPKWDIGAISGIPSWVELMLKGIIAHHRVDNIHEIWPNLQVYLSGGVAFEPYRAGFEKLLARPLTYLDTYLCSEGYLATQKRPETDAMALITDNGIFFEFVPFEEKNMDEEGRVKQDAEVHTLDTAKEGVNYVLLLSSVSGAWRYMIGDTVEITDLRRAEIRITGRTKHYLNVVGEQLSVHQMNKAIKEVCDHFEVTINEFVVSSIRDEAGEHINKWYFGVDATTDKENEMRDYLDEQLQKGNKNYKVARSKSLKYIDVKAVPVERFYDWSEKYKKLGGQVKIPRVMKEKDFREFEDFVSGN